MLRPVVVIYLSQSVRIGAASVAAVVVVAVSLVVVVFVVVALLSSPLVSVNLGRWLCSGSASVASLLVG